MPLAPVIYNQNIHIAIYAGGDPQGSGLHYAGPCPVSHKSNGCWLRSEKTVELAKHQDVIFISHLPILPCSDNTK